jgi:hypothetical protein
LSIATGLPEKDLREQLHIPPPDTFQLDRFRCNLDGLRVRLGRKKEKEKKDAIFHEHCGAKS